MNRKLEIVYNRWPLVTLLAGVYFMLLQFVLNYIWNVLCWQQFSPNLLHWNFPIISFSLKTYLLVSLLSVLTLGAVWGKSSSLKHCFLVMWIKGDSKRLLTVRHAWRRCAPTQFFPHNKTIPTLKATRSPIKIYKNRQGSVLKEEEEWLLHHLHPSETPLKCLWLAEHSIHISGKVLWELKCKLSPAEFSLTIKTMSHKSIHVCTLQKM